jgi:hypothetical protein
MSCSKSNPNPGTYFFFYAKKNICKICNFFPDFLDDGYILCKIKDGYMIKSRLNIPTIARQNMQQDMEGSI